MMSPNNPAEGRWLTPDPLGGDVTNPQSLNRYAYALNNPATLTDPLGLAAADPASPQTWNRYAYVSNNPLSFVDPQGLGRCVPGAPNYENDCQPPSGEGYTGDSYSEWPVNNMDPACGANVPWSWERYHMCSAELATLPLRPIGRKLIKSLLPQVECGDATPQQEQQVLQQARSQIRKPYLRGGGRNSCPANGFDCSGFVSWSIKSAGFAYNYTPTGSMAASPYFRTISTDTAQPGDVMLFPGHTGFYDPGQSSIGPFLSARSSRGVGIQYGQPSWFGNNPMYLRLQICNY